MLEFLKNPKYLAFSCAKSEFQHRVTDDQKMCEIQATNWTFRCLTWQMYWFKQAIQVIRWQMLATNERYDETFSLHIFLALIFSVLAFQVPNVSWHRNTLSVCPGLNKSWAFTSLAIHPQLSSYTLPPFLNVFWCLGYKLIIPLKNEESS